MDENSIVEFTNQQLKNILVCKNDVTPFVKIALERTLKCFEYNNDKYYKGKRSISLYNTGQYSIYLYYLANTIYNSGNNELATKVYYLNKVLHSVDWFYEIELPEYWGVEHPVGSVLGRAKYQNGLFIYQGCTVGGSKNRYPCLGYNVILYSNSTILGDCNIGNNIIVSTGTTIKDENIPNNSLVFGQSPNLVIKEKTKEYIQKIIDEIWINNQTSQYQIR